MKKKNIIIGIIVLLFIIFIGPIIINEFYKKNQGYITLWGAKEVFYYYGTVISALGTIGLGIITVFVTSKLTEVSNGLQRETLKINAYSSVQIEKCFIYDFHNHSDLRIIFKANNPFVNSIIMNELSVFFGIRDNIIVANEIKFHGGECRINSQNGKIGECHLLVDIPLPKEEFKKLNQLKMENRIRIKLSFEIVNNFKVNTNYSGEIMFNREESDNTKVSFTCTDNFTSIQKIGIKL